MHIDRDQFLDQGYLILRNFFSQERIQSLRLANELAVERQKTIWRAKATPDELPGGEWDWGGQPRLLMEKPGLIDATNVLLVEQWVDDQVMEVVNRLICHADASVGEMVLLCNPSLKDHGPSCWHRDMDSVNMAPLQQLIDDVSENGTRYLQWSVPLYDDDVFWVVPGSHRQNDGGNADRSTWRMTTPIPGAIQAKLHAGDVIVYINQILHWGSNYSRLHRRTMIVGHSIYTSERTPAYRPFLGAAAERVFKAADVRTKRNEMLTELALRAALNRDATSYHCALEGLHPNIGPKGKLLLTTYLDKVVRGLVHQHRRDISEEVWHDRFIGRLHPITLRWGRDFVSRFTDKEIEALHDRFAGFDAALRNPDLPGHRQQDYLFTDVPGISVDTFTADWGCSTSAAT